MAGELDLTKKVGPLPLWGWGLGVAAVGFFLISRQKAAAAAASGTGGGATSNGQFSSSTTTTDPTTGNTTTYQASGPNSSITSPAQLTYGAGPMGYSDGDVYVNYPAQSAAPGPPGPPGPAGPPGPGRPPLPPPPRNPDWGKWETFTNGDSIQALTSRVLGSGDLWQKVWNDPVNQAVRSLRGDPSKLQPGDVVWVFNGWAPGWKAPADFVPYNPDAAHPSPAGPVVTPPQPDPSQN